MNYVKRVKSLNELDAAFKVINSFQEGNNNDALIHCLINKEFELPSGKQGDLIELAIECHKYIAANGLSNYNFTSSDDQRRESLEISMEHYTGVSDLEKLSEELDGNYKDYYRSMVNKIKNNIEALELLKTRYKARVLAR